MKPIHAIPLLALLAAAGCSDEGDTGGPVAPQCSGPSCACPSGASCDFTQSSCGGGSCSLDCTSGNVCNGSCEESCSIDCANQSTCTVTVGQSGSVSCTTGSTCSVTCTGQCSVTCAGDSKCSLKCAGDAAPKDIPEGGQCSA